MINTTIRNAILKLHFDLTLKKLKAFGFNTFAKRSRNLSLDILMCDSKNLPVLTGDSYATSYLCSGLAQVSGKFCYVGMFLAQKPNKRRGANVVLMLTHHLRGVFMRSGPHILQNILSFMRHRIDEPP